MVDLPRIANTPIEVRAPQSRLSPQDIASPYMKLAENLDKAGEVLSKDVAVPLAQRAGTESVTLDKDGQPVVSKGPLIVGDAGIAFARAARTTALSKAEPAIEEAALKARLAHPGDPEMVRQVGQQYVSEMVGKQNDPLLKSALEVAGNRAFATNVRTSILEADRINTRDFLASSEARLTAANDKAIALARQPGGVDTPEYKQTVADRAALYRELVADPRAKYPAARAQQEMNEQFDYEKGQAVIGHVVEVYKNKGNAAEARKFLTDWAWGPGSDKLSLSEQKRNHIVAQGVAALERVSAEDSVELKEFRSSAGQYIAGVMKAPATMNDIAHNGWMKKALELGDTKTAADLQALKIVQPLADSVKRLPTDQQARVIKEMERGIVPNVPGTQGELDLKGAAVANLDNATKQLGLNPQEKNLYKHHLDNLYGPGKVVNGSVSTVRNMTIERDGKVYNIPTVWDGKILSNEDAIARAEKEGMDKWPSYPSENAAFERYKTIHRLMDADTKAFQQNRVPGGLKAGSSIFDQDAAVMKLFEQTTRSLQEHLTGEVGEQVTRVVNDLTNDKPVTEQEIALIASSIQSTGRYDLVPKLTEAFDKFNARRGLTGEDRATFSAQLQAAISSGEDPVKRSLHSFLIKSVAEDAKALQEDPLVAGATKGFAPPPRPLSMDDPNAAAAELVQRSKNLSAIRMQEPSVGPHSVVLKGEIPGITAALTQGPVNQAAGFIQALGVLDPETRKATMADLAPAFGAMSKSYDPARMNLGMSAMDEQWRANPDTFARDFKEDSLKRLQTWQTWKDSTSAAEIVERFKRADDPSFAAARKSLGEAADKELEKWKPEDVAYAMGTSWGVPVLSRMANVVTGATPSIPSDGLQAAALKADFDTIYSDLRKNGVEAGAAGEQSAKRLAVKWGASEINGNTLMPHPPERHYPEINGSHDWMRAPLEEDIAKAIGKPKTSMQLSETGSHVRENWSYRLLADKTTEKDIAAGRPPSYQIYVKDATTGAENIPMDPSGKAMRYAWDTKPAQDAARKEFVETQSAIASLRGKKMRAGFALQGAPYGLPGGE